MTSVLLGHDALPHVIRPVAEAPGLNLLSAGPTPPNPADLLGSDETIEILMALAAEYDAVIIDGPPILPVTDALVLSRYADAVVVVAAAGETTAVQMERALELLRQADAPTVGVVLNKAQRRWGDGADVGYEYGYKYRYKNRYEPEESSGGALNGNGHVPAHSRTRSPHDT